MTFLRGMLSWQEKMFLLNQLFKNEGWAEIAL